MKIKVIFNFIYTMYYNGLIVFFDIFSIINMVHELKYAIYMLKPLIMSKQFFKILKSSTFT
jgi:hypothetical protein